MAEKKDLTNRPLVPNNKGGGSGAEALIALSTTNDPDHTILVTLNSFFTTPLRQTRSKRWRLRLEGMNWPANSTKTATAAKF